MASDPNSPGVVRRVLSALGVIAVSGVLWLVTLLAASKHCGNGFGDGGTGVSDPSGYYRAVCGLPGVPTWQSALTIVLFIVVPILGALTAAAGAATARPRVMWSGLAIVPISVLANWLLAGGA